MKNLFSKVRFLTLLFVFLATGLQAFAGDQELLGAGATFPQPLYSKMFDAYYQQYKVKVNYHRQRRWLDKY